MAELSQSVNTVCQFMHASTIAHFQEAKRVLCYQNGIQSCGIKILSASSHELYAFSDTDWAVFPSTRRSTIGFYTNLGYNDISWNAKKQSTVAHSSVEVEYRSMVSTTAELTWLSLL
ncbi:uncharacterized protein LOC110006931 [Amborella trichopoda]|uniref:uncharacterized protein LOC110006931 n=1 Tax=Amborella trichopoda TaxID=13333 RepID=UPI0009BD292F|nr:uncharacterized protein LOC110006931 [Amborella trichopoda]|eukprot:XP_020520699.1 uncharacterized protein LOC110006931 [Amborella trichopoda]